MTKIIPTDQAERLQRRFSHVRSWVFDLDNTLYPAHTRLFDQIDVRMRDYVSRLLGLEPDEAMKVQKEYYHKYGTTLRGLMIEKGIMPDDFLDYVHDIDHSPVEPDPALGMAIDALPGHKYIFTNGSQKHAENVIERLGISDRFKGIFDIVSAELIPKPEAATYDKFLKDHGIEPTEAAMFEDLSRNLTVPHNLGMVTTLIVPRGTRELFHQDWELEGQDAPHVEFVTDHLGEFLKSIPRFSN
jgi:putative hydrolase of the HAD superfamily